MEENPYDEIDDLFKQIRLRLIELRENAPEAVDDMKSSLTQLEDWVEKLVVDSLHLKSLKSESGKTATAQKRSAKASTSRKTTRKSK